MASEPTERSQESRHWIVCALLLALVILPALYVVSFGPLVARFDGTQQGRIRLAIVYAPMVWLHHYTPLREPIERYIDLCRR